MVSTATCTVKANNPIWANPFWPKLEVTGLWFGQFGPNPILANPFLANPFSCVVLWLVLV